MPVKAIFFDLDNTLYDGASYFRLAFRQIANYLAGIYAFAGERLFGALWDVFQEKGSLYATLFDDVLSAYGINDAALVANLVKMFHETPLDSLALYEDAAEVLPRLAGEYTLGLITNGYPDMQRRKVASLGLHSLLTVQVYTAEINCPKPDFHAYEHALRSLNAGPTDCVYVGDNPDIDFPGARQAGMHTVRLLRGEFAVVATRDGLVDAEIRDFFELEALLRQSKFHGAPGCRPNGKT